MVFTEKILGKTRFYFFENSKLYKNIFEMLICMNKNWVKSIRIFFHFLHDRSSIHETGTETTSCFIPSIFRSN